MPELLLTVHVRSMGESLATDVCMHEIGALSLRGLEGHLILYPLDDER